MYKLNTPIEKITNRSRSRKSVTVALLNILERSFTWKNDFIVSAIIPVEEEIAYTIRKKSTSRIMNTQLSVCGSDGCGIPINPFGNWAIAFKVSATALMESILANESSFASEPGIAPVLSLIACMVSC